MSEFFGETRDGIGMREAQIRRMAAEARAPRERKVPITSEQRMREFIASVRARDPFSTAK